jgi:hypothetical protein
MMSRFHYYWCSCTSSPIMLFFRMIFEISWPAPYRQVCGSVFDHGRQQWDRVDSNVRTRHRSPKSSIGTKFCNVSTCKSRRYFYLDLREAIISLVTECLYQCCRSCVLITENIQRWSTNIPMITASTARFLKGCHVKLDCILHSHFFLAFTARS